MILLASDHQPPYLVISLQRVTNAARSYLRSLLQVDEVRLVSEAVGRIQASMVMIDVGAHHGSSLKQFARSGAQVFAFEPDAKNRSILEQAFGHYSNVHIDSRAVGMESKVAAPFYSSPTSSGISGLSAFEEHHSQSATVEVTTLRSFLPGTRLTSIDFLKIDTEGYDYFVLRGYPWDTAKPRFIVCEFEDRKTIPLGYTYIDLADFLVERGYHVLVSEWYPITRYGVSHRWRRFAEYPTGLANEMSWGNLIACRDERDFARVLRAARRMRFRHGLSRMLHPL